MDSGLEVSLQRLRALPQAVLALGLPLVQRQGSGPQRAVVFAEGGEGDGWSFGMMLGTEAANRAFERFEEMFAKADERAGDDDFLWVKEGIDLAQDPAEGLRDAAEGFFDSGVAFVGGFRDFFDREGRG